MMAISSEPPTAEHVLLVEDEPLISEMLQLVLEDAGYCVTVRCSAELALAVLDDAETAPDALITDIHLGKGRPGWDVAKRAREANPHMPVIFVTGDSGHQWHAQGVPLSVMITKPFRPDHLVGVLQGLLA